MQAQPVAGADRERLVRLGLLQEQRLHLLEALRVLLREIVGLREVAAQVVELPDVLVRVPVLDRFRRPGRIPRNERTERAGVPAVVIDAAAAVVVEVLRALAARRLGIRERVSHADAVDRVLRETVHHLRRLDPEDFVERRHDVVDVVELGPRRLVGLDARRPGDRHRVARAAEMRGDELGVVERRVAGPCPSGVVHVVGLGAAQRIESAESLERGELLLHGVRDVVLREQLAHRADSGPRRSSRCRRRHRSRSCCRGCRGAPARRRSCRPGHPRAR